jgi:uncharacterized protein YbjT (DUF2867 family)
VTSNIQKNVVLVYASGMIGVHALRYALDDDTVAIVTSIVGHSLGISHPKLREIVHTDFADCSCLSQALSGQDAAVYCLGAYTGLVPDAELHKITVDYTIEFARVLRSSSPNAVLSFLSGNGADATGKSRIAFARYRGEAEAALLTAGFSNVYLFRPAYIYPVKPHKRSNFTHRLLRAMYPSFQSSFPNLVIRADELARVMVDVAIQRSVHGCRVLENHDIRAMVNHTRPFSA